MKTITEQVKDLENTRAAKAARMQEVMQKSLAEGRSSDEAEGEEFDNLDIEIKSLDGDLNRLRKLETLNAQSARPVEGFDAKSASASRGGHSAHIIIKSSDSDEKFKGQNFVRQVIAKAIARMEDVSPEIVAQQRWGKTNPTLVQIIKVAVPGGGAGSGEWGAELVTANSRYTGDFIEFLQNATVFDKLPLRPIPQNVMIKGQDGTSTAYWVGESKAIPATVADFFNVSLTPLKVAALAVMSNELIASTPRSCRRPRLSLVSRRPVC